jgi:hypothetical protein
MLVLRIAGSPSAPSALFGAVAIPLAVAGSMAGTALPAPSSALGVVVIVAGRFAPPLLPPLAPLLLAARALVIVAGSLIPALRASIAGVRAGGIVSSCAALPAAMVFLLSFASRPRCVTTVVGDWMVESLRICSSIWP